MTDISEPGHNPQRIPGESPDSQKKILLVRAQCIRNLYANSPIVYIAIPVIATIIVIMFWTSQPHAVLLGWLLANLVITGIRGLIIFINRHLQKSVRSNGAGFIRLERRYPDAFGECCPG